jgi:glycerophosphoryl diester phosphodiesterase
VTPIQWEPLEFDTYNARHTLVKEATIRALSEKGVAVNVWAVNEESDMRRFISAGVAGIITDFPQRLIRISKEK